jgi:hypothetical protein
LQFLRGGSSFHPRLALAIIFPVELKSYKDESLALAQAAAAKPELVGFLFCYLQTELL